MMGNKRTKLKRSILSHIFLGISAVLFLFAIAKLEGAGFRVRAQKSPSAAKPNIIFILTDDMDKDSLKFMPKVKSLLVNQGLSFTNYYISFPLCCPSRATILRGQYAHNTGILGNDLPSGGFQKFKDLGLENSTVATWFKDAGYDTILIGKYLNKYPGNQLGTYIPPGWTQWYGALGPASRGFNYTLNENGQLVKYGKKTNDYATDVYAKKAVDFISNPSNTHPFFMFVSVSAPHQPAVPAPRHKKLFQTSIVPRTGSFNEADVSDKPNYVKSLPLLSRNQIATNDALYRNQLRSLQAVDDLVEKIATALANSGKLTNTYIFFSSDNGFHLGQHRLNKGKMSPYVEDVSVPLIVRGPDITSDSKTSMPAGNIDLAPTFADIAGITSPDFVDGRSLLPLLNNQPPSNWRDVFLLEYPDRNSMTELSDESPAEAETAILPPYYAVISEKMSYVEYDTGEKEYYNLITDPYQLKNSYRQSNSLIKSLSSAIEKLKNCRGQECRNSERVLKSISKSTN